MKRLALLLTALCAFAVAVPAAQTAPTSDVGCTVEHVSNAECQGPDAAPAANACEINTWVGNARCDLTVPDGAASSFTGFAFAFAELQNDTWRAEFDYVIRDKATGQVLFSQNASETSPVSGGTTVPAVNRTFPATALAPGGGGEVVCEVTGTHSPAGAAMSAVAAVEGVSGEFNNRLRCSVN
jgi:hypothetical protein